MIFFKTLYNYLNKSFFRHLIFWIGVFLFYIAGSWEYYGSFNAILIAYTFKILLQCFTAYSCLYIIIPLFLKHKKWIYVALLFLTLMFVINTCYVSWRMFFLEPTYPNEYTEYIKTHGHLTFLQRICDWKAVVFSTPLFYLQPALLLIAFQFYKKQQRLLKLNEQKKTAELTALKNQLNPHFLFNTLNNLYALALKKSDKTLEVIEKLSDILDYILYRCNNTFVSLNKEVELIKNYIILEKIRYGKRVHITFNTQIEKEVKVAPLLLLTFIENAFKHGVTQELKEAIIIINISSHEKEIVFSVQNSKPKTRIEKNDKQSIGLKNVKKQLDLLYENKYSLNIKDEKETYITTLKLNVE